MDTHGVDLLPALERIYGALPADARLERLKGDASTRVYYRLHAPGAATGPKRAIVMHLPADALGSDEGTSGEKPRELPFLDVQRLLAARGVPVPAVLADDVPRRVVVLEDLGDETFEARLRARGREAQRGLYEQAVDLLADLHARVAPPPHASIAYERTFDEALLRWELDHFREWGIEALHGPMRADDRAALDRAFDALAAELGRAETGFVHRDYQSRNLMWARNDDGERLVVIDFQDALIGPRPYDLVALLCDSYVEHSLDDQNALIGRYVERAKIADAAAFRRTFWLQATQRKLKDSGRFVFIDRVRGNSGFLRSFVPSMRYVTRALAQSGDPFRIAPLLERYVPGYPDRVTPPPAVSPPR